ncbi:hypothetical protein B0J11DRAFT_390897, partial [Dendryphion nanum]
MLHFSALNFYVLPKLPHGCFMPHLVTIELGTFAGCLYMDFEEYVSVIKYVENEGSSAFTSKMVSFLLEWLALRRKGQDIIHTPMGYLCQNRPLDSSHTFF